MAVPATILRQCLWRQWERCLPAEMSEMPGWGARHRVLAHHQKSVGQLGTRDQSMTVTANAIQPVAQCLFPLQRFLF